MRAVRRLARGLHAGRVLADGIGRGKRAARTVSSFIPSGALIRTIANATDDVQRASSTFLEYVLEGLPVARQHLPERENELGESVRRPSGQRGLGALSPIQPSRARDTVTSLDREIQAAKREALRDLHIAMTRLMLRRLARQAQK